MSIFPLPDVFDQLDIDDNERIHHLEILDNCVMFDLEEKEYLVADMKPEHIIISEEDTNIWMIKEIVLPRLLYLNI